MYEQKETMPKIKQSLRCVAKITLCKRERDIERKERERERERESECARERERVMRQKY